MNMNEMCAGFGVWSMVRPAEDPRLQRLEYYFNIEPSGDTFTSDLFTAFCAWASQLVTVSRATTSTFKTLPPAACFSIAERAPAGMLSNDTCTSVSTTLPAIVGYQPEYFVRRQVPLPMLGSIQFFAFATMTFAVQDDRGRRHATLEGRGSNVEINWIRRRCGSCGGLFCTTADCFSAGSVF